MDELDKETVTPKYSTAFGELVTGSQVEVGRLRFEKGYGAVEHAHPQEQVLIVLEGRIYSSLSTGVVAQWTGVVVAIVLASAVYPAFRVTRLKPVEAMRHA